MNPSRHPVIFGSWILIGFERLRASSHLLPPILLAGTLCLPAAVAGDVQ